MRYLLILSVLMATSPAYAQYDNSYQAQESRAEMENARISQGVDMQNMQNHMNENQQQQQYQSEPDYTQPQSSTATSMYGTMYVGSGSGYAR